MTANGWFQIGLFLSIILGLTKPVGVYLTRVFNGEKTLLDFVLRPIERLIYKICGIDENEEMRWTKYTVVMLLFSGVAMALLYFLERTQKWLPFNPQKLHNVDPALAFGTAASFTTNTNWQAYTPETTMSYLALVRGIARRESNTLGNFWVDMTRCLFWVLLPACLVVSLVLVSQGVIQNLKPYATVQLVEPQTVQTQGPDGKTATQTVTQQTIAMGPAASQEVIKELGTNGGGFFYANSAHPFENPTPLSNYIEMLLIFAIPAGLTYTLGRMTGSQRHGWAVWAAMAALFLAAVTAAYWAEARGNPLLAGADQRAGALQSGGNMEGKEVRFGIANSALFATVTTDASCGAVNGMHDSFTPLGGMIPLINIMLGEIVFGGVGAGLYGVLVFVILSVFIAGLMVGRTPEYLGKKIESYDVKMAMLAVLILTLTILGFTAIAVVTPYGKAGITNPGPHGFTQILYAYVSSAGNNGSAFGGINANTLWYNTSTAAAQLLGRFFMIIPIMAMAGGLAKKKIAPESLGTFPVTGPLFSCLLVGVILIVGALTFFPALSLGPILEQLLMAAGKAF
jgi:potassium-transporting ATPase potassium-binding subunit